MAQSFPSGLQDKFNEAGFTNTLGDSSLSSSPDAGPPLKRRRYTKEYDRFVGTINLNYDDYGTFKTFYTTTLAGGTLTFNFTHPLTGLESEFQFVNPPQISPIGGKEFRISFNWIEVA